MYHIDQRPDCWKDNGQNSACGAGTCVYVYSSEPRPMPIYGGPKFRNNVPYPRGAGDYYNLMWDGRIFRGRPNKKREKYFIECFNVRKPKTIVRPPKFIYERPLTPPPERRGRGRYDGQPETNLEDLDPYLIEKENAVADLESTLDLPQCPSMPNPPTGIDVSTQILPGDIFDFDLQVVPITESLVGQIVERAIHELLEEEELMALRIQQSNFENLILKEQNKLLELKEQQDRRDAEEARVATDVNKDATDRIEAIAFASFYLGGPLSDVLDGLRYQNKDDELKVLISSVFNPWLNELTQAEVKAQKVCRDLLDDVILSTVGKREAEYVIGKWRAEQEELRQMLEADMIQSSNFVLDGEDMYGEE